MRDAAILNFDQAATTWPKPPEVEAAMVAAVRAELGNPGRGGHRLARASQAIVDRARLRLNRLIGGAGAERIILTSSGTDALNIAIKGSLGPGDHAVTGVLEHNSVLRPLARLEREGVITLTRLGVDAEGYYDPDELRAALTERTKLVALTHVSNALGTVQPTDEFSRICRERNVILLIDAAQSAGVIPIDVTGQGISLLAAPGHKGLFGPTGTGFLHVAPGVNLRPWREGGTGDSRGELQPVELPEALEAGTPNVIGAAGLVAGLEWLERYGVDRVLQHERSLLDHLLNALESIPGLRLIGASDQSRHLGIVSFVAEWAAPEDLAAMLDVQRIAVRAGLHCAPLAHEAMGTAGTGTVRVSVSALNTADEVALLRDALDGIHRSYAEMG
jgi:cysteine desulfurase family protein